MLKWRGSTPAPSWSPPPPTYLTRSRHVKSRPSQTSSNFKVAPKEELWQTLTAKPQTLKVPAAQLYFHCLDPFAKSCYWWPAWPPCTQRTNNKQKPADTQRHLQNTTVRDCSSEGNIWTGMDGEPSTGSVHTHTRTHMHTHPKEVYQGPSRGPAVLPMELKERTADCGEQCVKRPLYAVIPCIPSTWTCWN